MTVKKLVGHENLLEFYLLSTSHEQLRTRAASDFEVVDDKYLEELKETSIPENFKNGTNSEENENEMPDENDPSKLVSILGNYQPPQNCDIPRKLSEHHRSLLKNLYNPKENFILKKIENVDGMHDDDEEEDEDDDLTDS